MNLNIRNVTKIEVGAIQPMGLDTSDETNFYRCIKITYCTDEGNQKLDLVITAITDDKYDCEEAAKKNLGVEVA